MRTFKNSYFNLKLQIIIITCFILVFIYFLFFFNKSKILSNPNQQFISFFIAILDKDKKNINNLLYTSVVFYFPKFNFFCIYQLISDIYLNQNSTNNKNKFTPLFNKTSIKYPKFLLKDYEKYSQQKIDHYLIIQKEQLLNIMELAGGCVFFNLYSTNMNYGEVLLNKKNYDFFVNGINDQYHRRDTKLSIWINQITAFFKKNSTINYNNQITKNIYKKFNHINLKRRDFTTLLKYFSKNWEWHHFEILNINIKKINYQNQIIKTLVNNNHLEIKKINKKIASIFNKENLNTLKIPTIEIKNATSIKRLATKTTGILRRKNFNVIEYSNNKFKLKKSVILKNLGTPMQQKFISKITKINNVYYIYSYKNNTDFSLYLGEDYYGAKDLQNKK